MLYLCGCMAEQAKAQIFIIANGECTLRTPNILILNQIQYQDPKKYRRMTLDQFLNIGNYVVDENDSENEEDILIEEMLTVSFEYLKQKRSDYELYDYLGNIQREKPALYRRYIRRLRRELYCFGEVDRYIEAYMILLYLAYKIGPTKDKSNGPELEGAPYDFGGMYQFLGRKARNKREWKRFVSAMVETQFLECAGIMNDWAVQNAAHHIAELL